ncbi:ABC transporter ATP-binding protein [Bartonella sp. HY406]|uniref:ABC transporter ATP-binding protein n=1 Tax=Bartonella sp. HY406 TaxID=2979331 RepID=UPI0021C954D8|nr:ABC transporter ATP-binding protein [Bartonella sp. HY406]UXN03549.1 ABC transporter ATP-binding protein [Bartonella sp. HY406]
MTAIFEVSGLLKNFGGLAVTNNVSLSMQKGDRLALIGPNGAGKTTLVNLVTGHLKPSAGAVILAGEDITNAKITNRVRKGLVRSFQVTRLFKDMTPEQHIALALMQHEGKTNRIFGNYRSMSHIMDETYAILAKLRLDSLALQKVAFLAYGQQRLLEIAISLAMHPKVLLLDEPAAGVPQSETGLIEDALASLPDDLAVLMIEHDMDLVFRFASRVIVLAAGSVIFDGSPQDVIQDSHVRTAYLGSYAQ